MFRLSLSFGEEGVVEKEEALTSLRGMSPTSRYNGCMFIVTPGPEKQAENGSRETVNLDSLLRPNVCERKAAVAATTSLWLRFIHKRRFSLRFSLSLFSFFSLLFPSASHTQSTRMYRECSSGAPPGHLSCGEGENPCNCSQSDNGSWHSAKRGGENFLPRLL